VLGINFIVLPYFRKIHQVYDIIFLSTTGLFIYCNEAHRKGNKLTNCGSEKYVTFCRKSIQELQGLFWKARIFIQHDETRRDLSCLFKFVRYAAVKYSVV